ncbi:MAG: class I SAM-dependent methyltransferase, partial [Caldilineaceae bacterium]|nr:class I SAM-dependent methyltransferase [Caldilineaceae bacterium]
ALSQFGLMFFTDRKQAIQEMARVVEPGGRVVVAVWDRLEKTQGYAKIAELVQQLFGSDAADAIRAPFCLGDVNELQKLFSDQSLTDLQIVTRTGTARFPSIDGWIYTEIKGWTLADYLSDEQFEQLLAEARIALQSYINAQGIVTFTTSAHIVSATVV